MNDEQMKKIIKYLIQIKFPLNTCEAIDLILDEVDSQSRLEALINELLEMGTEEPQIRGL